ncbi:MAG: hypothetical protein AAF989_12195 [Planctomycetota bacterium]
MSNSNSNQTRSNGVDRRGFFRKAVAAGATAAGAVFVAKGSEATAQNPVTMALGENGAPTMPRQIPRTNRLQWQSGKLYSAGNPSQVVTTRALGEEGNPPVNRPGNSYGNKQVCPPQTVTTQAFGEEGNPNPTTRAVGEEGTPNPTTWAVGEEGPPPTATTQAVGEEGNPTATTMATGEEGNPNVTTRAVGEEGAPLRQRTTGNQSRVQPAPQKSRQGASKVLNQVWQGFRRW